MEHMVPDVSVCVDVRTVPCVTMCPGRALVPLGGGVCGVPNPAHKDSMVWNAKESATVKMVLDATL